MDVIEDFFPQSILRETKKKPISTLAGAVMIFPGDWMMASSGACRLRRVASGVQRSKVPYRERVVSHGADTTLMAAL